MLTPDFLWHAADKVVEIWEKFNVWAILDICRRIMDAGGHMTASAEWQIYKMEQSGMARDDIMKAMRRVTKLSEEEVQRIFEEAAVESHGNDADIFAEAGAQTEPLNTKAARDAMQTFYEQTNGELSNFTRTTANAAQRIYIEACDNAFLKVRSGLMSQDQAIREAIEAAAADGLYVTYPSGHRDTVEVAVRRAVTTGVNRAALQLTIDECERQGTNYVIVSSHLGARVHDTNPIANHAGWQGQVYMIKPRQRGFWGALGKFADIIRHQNYPLLREATGYPDDPLGLGGYNCRHSMYPYIPGITKNHMTQYDSEENRKAYELSQEQRKREREIRRTKRELEGAKLCGDTEKARELQARLKRQQADYRDFCSRNGLQENFERTYTADIAKGIKARKKISAGASALSGRKVSGLIGKTESSDTTEAKEELAQTEKIANNPEFRPVPKGRKIVTLRRWGRKWEEKLSPEEIATVRQYIFEPEVAKENRLFSKLNRMMLGIISPSPELEKARDLLSSALHKSPIPEDVVVFRGSKYDFTNGAKEGAIGDIVQFLSTSGREMGAFRKGVMFEIHVRAGVYAGYLEGLAPGGFKEQRELLIDYGQHYRVISRLEDKIVVEVTR